MLINKGRQRLEIIYNRAEELAKLSAMHLMLNTFAFAAILLCSWW